MPLINRTIAIAQLSLVDCASTTFRGGASKSADISAYRMGRNAGHEGDEMYTLI
jgi:hypothetical protein